MLLIDFTNTINKWYNNALDRVNMPSLWGSPPFIGPVLTEEL